MKYLLPILFSLSACTEASTSGYSVGEDYIFECGEGDTVIPDLPWGDYTTAYCADGEDTCRGSFHIEWDTTLGQWYFGCNGNAGHIIVHVNWIPEPNI